MIWLCIGVLLFMLVHFVPTLARGLKSSLIVHLGERPYRGLFSLFLVISIALIVFGWRSTDSCVSMRVSLAGPIVVKSATECDEAPAQSHRL